MKAWRLVVWFLGSFCCLAEGITVCYYGSWAVYRRGGGKVDVEDIDPFLCSHLIYGFAGLDAYTYNIKVLDPWNDLFDAWGKGAYLRFTGLKKINPELKTSLAVGGWNEGSSKYSIMAANPVNRKKFVTSSVELLVKYGFDGLDMDWEYPVLRGGSPRDKENFVTLLSELRVALDAHGMLLTAAVSAGVPTIDAAYDVAAVSSLLDYVHLMTYDFHGSWESFTHHNAPLRPHPLDQGMARTFNVEYAVQYWLNKGAPKDKLVLGLASYGRCYTLASGADTGYYASAPSAGPPGPYTGTPGTLGYNEICEIQQATGDWITVHDPAMNEPYTYRLATRTWCGYDDVSSIAVKSAFARDMDLAGTMFWSIETDDFRGRCTNSRPFDLIKTSRETFSGSPTDSTTRHAATTTSPDDDDDTSTTRPAATTTSPDDDDDTSTTRPAATTTSHDDDDDTSTTRHAATTTSPDDDDDTSTTRPAATTTSHDDDDDTSTTRHAATTTSPDDDDDTSTTRPAATTTSHDDDDDTSTTRHAATTTSHDDDDDTSTTRHAATTTSPDDDDDTSTTRHAATTTSPDDDDDTSTTRHAATTTSPDDDDDTSTTRHAATTTSPDDDDDTSTTRHAATTTSPDDDDDTSTTRPAATTTSPDDDDDTSTTRPAATTTSHDDDDDTSTTRHAATTTSPDDDDDTSTTRHAATTTSPDDDDDTSTTRHAATTTSPDDDDDTSTTRPAATTTSHDDDDDTSTTRPAATTTSPDDDDDTSTTRPAATTTSPDDDDDTSTTRPAATTTSPDDDDDTSTTRHAATTTSPDDDDDTSTTRPAATTTSPDDDDDTSTTRHAATTTSPDDENDDEGNGEDDDDDEDNDEDDHEDDDEDNGEDDDEDDDEDNDDDDDDTSTTRPAATTTSHDDENDGGDNTSTTRSGFTTFVIGAGSTTTAASVTNSSLKDQPCRTGESPLRPHADCDKYWSCHDGVGIEQTCLPGLYYNPQPGYCDYPHNVDTSKCREPGQTNDLQTTIAEASTNDFPLPSSTEPKPETVKCNPRRGSYYLPHRHCNKFWWCVHGIPYLQMCPASLVWQQKTTSCNYHAVVDTSSCTTRPRRRTP